MRQFKGLVAGLLVLFVSSAAQAQSFWTPEMADKIRLGGITRWEFAKVAVKPDEMHYVAFIGVQFENRSEYYVVFKKPLFSILLKKTVRPEAMTGKVTSADGNLKGDVVITPNANEQKEQLDDSISMGPVRLAGLVDLAAHKRINRDNLLDIAWEKERKEQYAQDTFSVKPGKENKPTIEEHYFMVDFGPVGIETADQLLLKVFNTVNGPIPWSTNMSGDTEFGVRGLITPTIVFSPGRISIEIAGKPPVKLDVAP